MQQLKSSHLNSPKSPYSKMFQKTKKLYLVSSFVTDIKLNWRNSHHCQCGWVESD